MEFEKILGDLGVLSKREFSWIVRSGFHGRSRSHLRGPRGSLSPATYSGSDSLKSDPNTP